MEGNAQLKLAHDFLCCTGVNIFLTGKAGTGKTTFLRSLKTICPKRMIVVAPTGVAAINAGGVTIHSFFQLPFGPYVPGIKQEGGEKKSYLHRFSKEKINIIRSLDLLIIDEISMVRADLLDAVSDVLCRYRDRSRPFGGVQLLLIGDLQQLAPVVKEEEWELLKERYESPFFFNSLALRRTSCVTIELLHVYRQSDAKFIDLLNKIRENQTDAKTLAALNSRYLPSFEPEEEEGYITLTTHNVQAQQINKRKLEEIQDRNYAFPAIIEGEFPAYSFPTEERLVLKKGAQVMFVKNDSSPERRYYNGKIGKIASIGEGYIRVKCKGEEVIEVNREEWTNTKYTIDPQTKDIRETVEGVFRQYPLKLAWAITIHKSQGLTFERAIIDAAAAFTHGQVYVALSRCKSLEGIVLSSPLKSEAVISDRNVQYFHQQIEQHPPGEKELKEAERAYLADLLKELFDFAPLWKELQRAAAAYGEYFGKLYPDFVGCYRTARERCYKELTEVGERFKLQLSYLVISEKRGEEDEQLQERIRKGSGYFLDKLKEVTEGMEVTTPETDNKEIKKAVETISRQIRREIHVKSATLRSSVAGFSVKEFLSVRAEAVLELPRGKTKKEGKATVPADILHPALYQCLLEWRKEEAAKLNLPVYTIMQQKALLGVCNLLPAGKKELMKIPGIGEKLVKKYGVQLIRMVDEYRCGERGETYQES